MTAKRTRQKPVTKSKPVAALCMRSSPFELKASQALDALPFNGVAYNGGIMYPTLTLDGEPERSAVVVDLDTLVIQSEDRPVLDDHDDSTDGLIGRTITFAVDRANYTLPVSGVLYPQKERAKQLLKANKGGHKWQLSVGLDQFDVERVPEGRTVRVNNQTFKGPLVVARRAYLTDVSFVAVGGDDTTWATIAARRLAKQKSRVKAGRAMEGSPMTFDEWMAENFPTVDFASLSDAEKARFNDMFEDSNEVEAERTEEGEEEEEEAPKKPPVAKAKRKKPVARAKRTRSRPIGTDGSSTDKIVERVTRASIAASRAEASRCARIDAMANGNTELAEQAKSEGWDVDKFELHQLRAGRSTPSGASTKPANDEGEVFQAALLLGAGFTQNVVGKWYSQDVMNKALAGRFRGFSLVECGEKLMRVAGISHEGARNQKSHMMAVRRACEKLEAGGYTSMTLSNILENAADKVLLNAYQAFETKWQEFCAIRSVNDFKIHSSYALDPLSVFKKVGTEGDFSNLQMGDRKYSLSADSFGVRLKIDYQTWRNDDMSAINDRLQLIGQLGAATIEQVVHTLLMNGIGNTALFHANNKNYDVTAACLFGITGLTFGEKMWGNQVRQNGTPLGVSPQTLMVGTALKTLAGQVFTSAKLNEVFDSTNNSRKGPVGSDNPFVSKYKPVDNPYLNNTLLKDNTGPGDTGVAYPHQDDGLWMLLARQGNIAPINVCFLDGAQSPKVEVINNQSELVGFELLAALHFGVGYGDPKLAACFNPNNA